MDEVGLVPFEKIGVYNINNGERFETYIIEGARGSGIIGLNGAASRKGLVGDLVIIVSYAVFSDDELAGYKPKIVMLGPDNAIKATCEK
jgi:aspartate 1-decarboxylase